MSRPVAFKFAHVFREGWIDSICSHCLATIATTGSEMDLALFEREHQCDPWKLTRVEQERNSWKLARLKYLDDQIDHISHRD